MKAALMQLRPFYSTIYRVDLWKKKTKGFVKTKKKTAVSLLLSFSTVFVSCIAVVSLCGCSMGSPYLCRGLPWVLYTSNREKRNLIPGTCKQEKKLTLYMDKSSVWNYPYV